MSKYFVSLFMISLCCFSCKKQTEVVTSENINDYFPLQPGKYIIYQLDSTIFVSFGTRDSIVSYQAKDLVDAPVTDNLGRTGYRILRYIRKDSSQNWIPNNTFMAIPTGKTIEYIEDNIRFVKLVMPVKQDLSWKGNSYISPSAYSSYGFVSDFTSDWEYVYDSIDVPLTINALSFDSTIKVNERDDLVGNDPVQTDDIYDERTIAIEKYAKGVGLIYREFLHSEYQGLTSITPGFTGFGIKLTIIGHN